MKLTKGIQASLVALLSYSVEYAPQIMGVISPKEFDLFYRQIAEKAVDYINTYGKPPGEHTYDLIEELKEQDEKSADIYRRIYESLLETSEDVNPEWVLDKTKNFAYLQRVKRGFQKALPLVATEEDDKLKEAKTIMELAFKESNINFDAGTCFTETSKSLSFLNKEEKDVFPFGVKEFDAIGVGPARKRLMLLMGGAKAGKSWLAIHIAKHCLMARKKVLHITLEMPEEEVAQRYCQSLFSISQREATAAVQEFQTNEKGDFLSWSQYLLSKGVALTDHDIKNKLTGLIKKCEYKLPLFIKEFPTSGLSIDGLKSYLDHLESSKGFVPDLLIVDYPDLMDFNQNDFRHALGKVYQQIRGIGMERNFAVVCPTQANREGAKAKKMSATHVGDDWSKICTLDALIAINQTEPEYNLGLARLQIAAIRGEAKFLTVLISQALPRGQFCLHSAKMSKKYWDAIGPDDED
jgi:replicative DNA helicase